MPVPAACGGRRGKRAQRGTERAEGRAGRAGRGAQRPRARSGGRRRGRRRGRAGGSPAGGAGAAPRGAGGLPAPAQRGARRRDGSLPRRLRARGAAVGVGRSVPRAGPGAEPARSPSAPPAPRHRPRPLRRRAARRGLSPQARPRRERPRSSAQPPCLGLFLAKFAANVPEIDPDNVLLTRAALLFPSGSTAALRLPRTGGIDRGLVSPHVHAPERPLARVPERVSAASPCAGINDGDT